MDQAVSPANRAFLEYISNGSLADTVPGTESALSIDLLIGSDYFWQVVEVDRITLPSVLTLVSSKLGYLITGSGEQAVCSGSQNQSMPHHGHPAKFYQSLLSVYYSQLVPPNISDHWQLENIGIQDSPHTNDGKEAHEPIQRDHSIPRWPVLYLLAVEEHT